MQRQRGELVPIGDALSGLGGPVKGIVKLTGCRAASRPIEYSGVVLLTIFWGCLSL